MKKLKSLLITALAFMIVFGSGGGLIFYCKAQLWPHEEVNFFMADRMPGFVPKYKDIDKALIGYDNFVGDLYWLRAVQFAGANARSLELDSLYEYLDLITDIDPQFLAPYKYGALLLPLIGKAEKGVLLLEKGRKAMPDNWQIVWDLAFIKYYYLDQYEEAIDLYKACLKLDGCLIGAQKTIANLQAKKGKYEIAEQEWLKMAMDDSLGPEQKQMATEKAEEAGDLIRLNRLAKQYYQDKGEYINSLDDLKVAYPDFDKENFISPFEMNPYMWDPATKTVRTQNW